VPFFFFVGLLNCVNLFNLIFLVNLLNRAKLLQPSKVKFFSSNTVDSCYQLKQNRYGCLFFCFCFIRGWLPQSSRGISEARLGLIFENMML